MQTDNTDMSMNGSDKLRFFKLFDTTTGVYRGRHCGYTPEDVAQKIFDFKKKFDQNTEGDLMTIHLEECTRGSDKKVYDFRCTKNNMEISLI